ncbi:MAG: hypothetical protein ACKOBW_14925 [Planctomycetota bacterium]
MRPQNSSKKCFNYQRLIWAKRWQLAPWLLLALVATTTVALIWAQPAPVVSNQQIKLSAVQIDLYDQGLTQPQSPAAISTNNSTLAAPVTSVREPTTSPTSCPAPDFFSISGENFCPGSEIPCD